MSLGQSSNANAPTIEYSEVRAVIVSTKEVHYPDLIAKLNCCENRCKWDENKILDRNDKYSYGGLMFQMATFLQYGKKYNVLPEWVDESNFETYIYDRDIQTLIADKMIADGLGDGYAGWYNCFRIYNLSQYL
jgi:hypothetical protein